MVRAGTWAARQADPQAEHAGVDSAPTALAVGRGYSRWAVHLAPARSSPVCTAASRGDDLKETIVDTITTALADSLRGERPREADRARPAVSARAARRSARRARAAATPASQIIQNRPYMHPACERAIIGYVDRKRG
jgi:hypothetical protein